MNSTLSFGMCIFFLTANALTASADRADTITIEKPETSELPDSLAPVQQSEKEKSRISKVMDIVSDFLEGESDLSSPGMAGVISEKHKEEHKFIFTPGGRILLDAAFYTPDTDGFAPGFSVPDVRIGGKAHYGNWLAVLDFIFGYGKLMMSDVYIRYNFKGTNNYLQGGYFVHPFGLSSATSSSFKPTGENPSTDDFFSAGHKLGISFILNLPKFFMGVSAITGTGLDGFSTTTQGKTSFGGLGRFVYRPLTTGHSVIQFGCSPWYQSALKQKITTDEGTRYDYYFAFNAYYPTRVARVPGLVAIIPDAKGIFKISPELLINHKRFALESQYYYMNVARRNSSLPSYRAQGVYGLLRCLILGDKNYEYSAGDAALSLPGPRTLEAVAGFNYTNGCSAGINGGIMNDYSFTLNYYINKFMLARLAYHYTYVRNSGSGINRGVNIIQARLQFKF